MKTTVTDLIALIHSTYSNSPMPFNVHLILSHMYQSSGDSKKAKIHLEKSKNCCEYKNFIPIFEIEKKYLEGYRTLDFKKVYAEFFVTDHFFPLLPQILLEHYRECIFNMGAEYWTNFALFECAYNYTQMKDWENAVLMYNKVIKRSWKDFNVAFSYVKTAEIYQKTLIELKDKHYEEQITSSEKKEYENILLNKIIDLFIVYYDKFSKNDLLDKYVYEFTELLERNEYYDHLCKLFEKIDILLLDHELKQEFYYRMSKIFYRLEKFSKGRDICEKLLNIYPDNPKKKSVILRLAALYEKEGLFKNAVKIYTDIIENYDQQSIAGHANRTCLKIAYQFIEINDFENAIDTCNYILEKRYDKFVSSEALFILYTIYKKMRDRCTSDYDASLFERKIEYTVNDLAKNYPDSKFMAQIPDSDLEDNPKREKQKKLTFWWSFCGAILLVIIFQVFLPIPWVLMPVFFIGFFGIMYFVYYIIIF